MPTKMIAEQAPAALPTPIGPPQTVVVQQGSRIPVIGIVGISVGAVVLAGALFGGGLAVGLTLPTHGQPGASQHQFSGGANGFRGPGPVVPGQGHRGNRNQGGTSHGLPNQGGPNQGGPSQGGPNQG
ncbi:MAG: hypothetical protein ABJA94_05795, partial [Rhodoglobus sp.]